MNRPTESPSAEKADADVLSAKPSAERLSAERVAELAELAMLLEVCAKRKPGNIDREHDYDDTRIEHFLYSAVRARKIFQNIHGMSMGDAMYESVRLTNGYSGGNTHFGAFILLLPLIKGKGIEGAKNVVSTTTVDDAVQFYKAFGLTAVRVAEESDMDINDPTSIQRLKDEGLTMYNVMEFSSENDMVAREWTNGFALTREMADLLKESACGAKAISDVFLEMLARHRDTFVIKKFGPATADELCNSARMAASGRLSPEMLDAWCLAEGINPGSLADICIAGIFVALLEGWEWDYSDSPSDESSSDESLSEESSSEKNSSEEN